MMQNTEAPDQEPQDATPGNAADEPRQKTTRQILVRGRSVLTEKELASSGVRKFLIDEHDRLQEEIKKIEPYVEKFHAADKELIGFKERESVSKQSSRKIEIISSATLAVGSAALGAVPGMSNYQVIFGLFSAILIGISIYVKRST